MLSRPKSSRPSLKSLPTRDELKDIVEKFGGVARQQLSGKTDFLVYGEEPGAMKIDEAKKRGIIVMNIYEFFQLIH